MKHLKIVILGCAVVGLVALLVPFAGRSLLKDAFELGKLDALVYAAVFALPAIMAAMALARPPMQAWQPGVALAGFVLGIVRFHVWDIALHLGSAGLPWLLLLAAIVAGTTASVIALMKPEAL
ncbi:MAG: hypothetical protein ABIY55_08575 [Kofleriaceae bacterium]